MSLVHIFKRLLRRRQTVWLVFADGYGFEGNLEVFSTEQAAEGRRQWWEANREFDGSAQVYELRLDEHA